MESLVAVKLNFYGDLRRFSIVPTSFQALCANIASVLNIDANKELIVKYVDEESDLITLTSDLELKSAALAGPVLRLAVTFKGEATPAVLHAPAPSAPPVAAPPTIPAARSEPVPQPVAMDTEPVHLYPQIPRGGGWHRGPRPYRGFHHGEGFGRHYGGFKHSEDGRRDHHHHKGGRRGFKAWWNNENKEALMQQNQDLVEEVVKMGFGIPREKILKMILKTQWKCDMYGNKLGPNNTVIVSHVVSKLATKKERKEAKAAARTERKERMEEN